MPTVTESQTGLHQLAATLSAGVDTISEQQTITFVKYIRLVLPLDGYVFWVRSSLVSASAALNAYKLGNFTFNQAPTVTKTDTDIVVPGSLHYLTVSEQNDTDSSSQNSVVFTALEPVKDLDEVSPTVMFIGTWQGVRFSFSERKSFYQQANLYHYAGQAIFSSMDTQIIDNVTDLDTKNVVVSNSLPLWLAMNPAQPPYPYPASQGIKIYPAFLVPSNIVPPYAAINIVDTQAIQSTPTIGPTRSHSQLVEDTVEVTLFGLRNFNAVDFLDYVLNQSLATDDFGIMDYPVIYDERLTQVELMVIAMKKKITFRINYYQQRARDQAQQFILSCIPSFTVIQG